MNRGGTAPQSEFQDLMVGKNRTGSLLAEAYLGPASSLLYGGVAVSMVFFNKAVLSVYDFKESNVLLLLQMIAAVGVLVLLHAGGALVLEPVSWHRAKALVPVALLYNANVAFALASLGNLNVPMYNTMKRLTPSLVLAHDYVFSGAGVSREVVQSVMLTVSGCLVAGYGDLAFDPFGYAMAATSCILQASYLVTVQKTGAEKGISSNDLLLYNAILSIPVLLLVVLLDGEFHPAMTKLYARSAEFNFMSVLLASLLMGILLNYAIFLCTQNNSALTTCIVGVLKGVAATGLGYFLLGGVKFVPLNFAGIMINLVGGTWYTYIKYREKQTRSSGKPAFSV
eukprot:CAMPEP_0114230482 /NCGR_PEP_ID=MMETSP0058-20121206/3497_1 /TAXON_ID=36894 /ORGANISM="Pyramimonas parkeae, CCMP726" /LENGTH=339 /DNA_ID=CAMNT_0001341693 /DNA_START=131 /DNA_END=1151 /DNA_ORIENTATION=+